MCCRQLPQIHYWPQQTALVPPLHLLLASTPTNHCDAIQNSLNILTTVPLHQFLPVTMIQARNLATVPVTVPLHTYQMVTMIQTQLLMTSPATVHCIRVSRSLQTNLVTPLHYQSQVITFGAGHLKPIAYHPDLLSSLLHQPLGFQYHHSHGSHHHCLSANVSFAFTHIQPIHQTQQHTFCFPLLPNSQTISDQTHKPLSCLGTRTFNICALVASQSLAHFVCHYAPTHCAQDAFIYQQLVPVPVPVSQ